MSRGYPVGDVEEEERSETLAIYLALKPVADLLLDKVYGDYVHQIQVSIWMQASLTMKWQNY
jgi:hypothetical protein